MADAAQAVHSVVSGPRVPSAIDISAAPMFGIRAVTQNGLSRSGPASNSLRCAISSVFRPPMPVPIEQPIRSRVGADVDAGVLDGLVAAATANCAKRSVLRTDALVHVALGIEPLDLPGDPHVGGLEALDLGDAGAALAHDLPGLLRGRARTA